jgi:putative heme iron utilization protein
MEEEKRILAKNLVRSSDFGVLSTMSEELEGYPFGSIVPFVQSLNGNLVFLISSIAQHTKNIFSNSKCCLTVFDQASDDKQAAARVSVVGDGEIVPEEFHEKEKERYFSFFPNHQRYLETHDFNFVWLRPLRVRFIGGFGKIFWIEKEEWSSKRPDWEESSSEIISHMNVDHQNSLVDIAKSLLAPNDRNVSLVSIDQDGFHLRVNEDISYLQFSKPCISNDEIRQEFIRLAKESKRE